MKTANSPFSQVKLFLRALPTVFLMICLLLVSTLSLYAAPGAHFADEQDETSSGPWSSFSPADGLASSSLLSLLAGAEGELWAGTTGGANTLQGDGSWQTFTDADGLGGNIVTDIVAMPGNSQQYWFGAYGGVSLLDTGGSLSDPSRRQWATFSKQDGLVENWVSAVAVDQAGAVWIGTYFINDNGDDNGFGVSRLAMNNTPFNKSDDTWTTYTQATGSLSNNIIHDILVDDTGIVWIATASGLNAVHSGGWTVYYAGDGLPSNDITALAQRNGLLWIATKGGIAVMDDGGTPGVKTDDRWASFSSSANGLIANEISSLGFDSRGFLWAGTSRKTNDGEAGSGASVLDFNGTPFQKTDDRWASFTSSKGLAHNAVRSVSAWGDAQVAFGTRTGLSILNYGESPFTASDDKWRTFTSAGRLKGSLVTSVADGGFGMTWLGTEQGLNLLRYGANPHQKSDDIWSMYTPSSNTTFGAIQSLTLDLRGWLWLGATNGLWIIDSKRTPDRSDDDIIRQYKAGAGLLHDKVNDIVIDQAGRGWLATGDYFTGGLQVLDPGRSLSSTSDDVWATFTQQNSALPGSYVTSVEIDQAGSAWVGTSTGAARLEYGSNPFSSADDRWTVYRSDSSGLAYDNIRDVLIDSAGNAWFALLINGVSVRTADGAWQSYYQGDGIAYDSVYALAKDASGRIWIGTDGGGVSILDHRGTISNKSDDIWVTYPSSQTLLSGNIRALHVDYWGQVWIGTFGGGASVFSDAKLSQLFLPSVRTR